MFILYTLVIYIDLVVYNTQNEDFLKIYGLLNFWGKLAEEAPIFSHFSHFISLFLIGQTPSEDDFLEDEWLKLLSP